MIYKCNYFKLEPESGPTGAKNHQETCDANRTSTEEEENAAKCDRDEGDAKKRFNEAAQAFMEWMPIRRGPAAMGVVEITSITQVIEWGSLASIVAVDGRMTDRSAEPTLKILWNPFAFAAFSAKNMSAYYRSAEPTLKNLSDPFVFAAFAAKNISAYYDETSEIRQTFDAIAQGLKMDMADPKYSMIGEENRKLVRSKKTDMVAFPLFCTQRSLYLIY